MKAVRCILKVIAVLASVGAAVCLIVSYWDKILDAYYTVVDKIQEKKENCPFCNSEFDDFEDVEQ